MTILEHPAPRKDLSWESLGCPGGCWLGEGWRSAKDGLRCGTSKSRLDGLRCKCEELPCAVCGASSPVPRGMCGMMHFLSVAALGRAVRRRTNCPLESCGWPSLALAKHIGLHFV